MEIVVNRSKKLVESIKIFAGNKEEKLLESSEYTYNKKGQIIRILRSTTSPNDNLHQIKTNIKYEDNGITIQKDFDNGTKYLKTTITTLNNKKHILKFSKNNTGTIEKFKYTEKEALCSSREKEGTGVLFEASGDPLTGEMVFSKNITSPCNRGEYIELLSNGNYYKQVVAKDWHISTKEIPASIADDFIHQKVDLMTPENEMLTKLEEYGL